MTYFSRPITGIVGKGMPWCYTTDPDKPWEACNIPVCENDAQEQGLEPAPAAAQPASNVGQYRKEFIYQSTKYQFPRILFLFCLMCCLYMDVRASIAFQSFCRIKRISHYIVTDYLICKTSSKPCNNLSPPVSYAIIFNIYTSSTLTPLTCRVS